MSQKSYMDRYTAILNRIEVRENQNYGGTEMIDYLDKPPQRYAHVFQRNSGSREMVEASEGEWVKFEDMDLYMFEGGQLMQRMLDDNKLLREALETAVSAMEQWVDAVDYDASWDGWDHHYKAVASSTLPACRAALGSAHSAPEKP